MFLRPVAPIALLPASVVTRVLALVGGQRLADVVG